jgi:glycosyltransferase involved in cell wall biosynthesis
MKVVHTKKTKKDQIVNLLFYGDFNCTTGFGNVSKQLIDNWSKNKNFNITVLAINDFTDMPSYKYKDNVLVIPCLKADSNKDSYARLELLKMLYNLDFDVFFALNDVEVINTFSSHIDNVKKERNKKNKKKTKYIIYTPIDSDPRPSDVSVLKHFDEIITYTEYGKTSLKHLMSESDWKKVKVIPHGIDTNVFYPLPEEKNSETKKNIFGSDDVFVFGTVNRNSARKDLATLMIGYAMFKHTSQVNAVLYIHTNPKDSLGIDCFRLSERLGLEVGKDIFFPKDFSENKGFSEAELNEIYNMFDCFITTTTAEGWGLTVAEAMAVNKLVVCPKHTSLTEITNMGKNAFTFKFIQRAVFTNDYEKIRFISNPDEVSQVCGIVYNLQNEELEVQQQVEDIKTNAYNFITKWNWKDISKKMELIIINTL